MIGIPVTAAGFTFDAPVVSAAGGTILALAFGTLALLTVVVALPSGLPDGTRVLLGLSSICAVVGMALAFHYSVGRWLGWSTLTIDRMVQIHGIANGLGFVTLGLLGWSTARDAMFAQPPPDRFA